VGRSTGQTVGLPESLRGQQSKVFILLDDPTICVELCSFVHSNKWSMNAKKLAEFSKDNMVTPMAENTFVTLLNQRCCMA
jgi:hypothetical protein